MNEIIIGQEYTIKNVPGERVVAVALSPHNEECIYTELITPSHEEKGWSRDGDIPSSYVSRGTNKYWTYRKDELIPVTVPLKRGDRVNEENMEIETSGGIKRGDRVVIPTELKKTTYTESPVVILLKGKMPVVIPDSPVIYKGPKKAPKRIVTV